MLGHQGVESDLVDASSVTGQQLIPGLYKLPHQRRVSDVKHTYKPPP